MKCRDDLLGSLGRKVSPVKMPVRAALVNADRVPGVFTRSAIDGKLLKLTKIVKSCRKL